MRWWWWRGGWVIPADRRGSCCFLLGIVTVTFHGASHAGITKKKIKVCQFWKSIPFAGEWALISWLKKCPSSFSHWLIFFRLNSWIGSSEDKLKNYEWVWPAPVTFMSIKYHLPSSPSWQEGGEEEAATARSTQVFSSLPLKKTKHNLLCCWRRTRVRCAFYAQRN